MTRPLPYANLPITLRQPTGRQLVAIITQSDDFNKWDGAVSYTSRVPLGVCAGIGAWNFPMQIACRKSAPALAAGNPSILKPSKMTPLVAHKVANILTEARLPDGLLQVIRGTHEIGRAICEHPSIAKVPLTGGMAIVKLIMSQSASTLKKITLELSSKSPLLVFDDCYFDLAVKTALDANFYTAGEACSNPTRVFVQRSIADKFIAAMVDKTERMVVGDPMATDVNMGALISGSHLGKVLDYVKIGRAEGAQIATGGKKNSPTGL